MAALRFGTVGCRTERHAEEPWGRGRKKKKKKKKTGAWDKPERLERRGYKQTNRQKEWLKKKKNVCG